MRKENVGGRCCAFAFFFSNYDRFLLKPAVNLIIYNILRRFSITVLECMS